MQFKYRRKLIDTSISNGPQHYMGPLNPDVFIKSKSDGFVAKPLSTDTDLGGEMLKALNSEIPKSDDSTKLNQVNVCNEAS